MRILALKAPVFCTVALKYPSVAVLGEVPSSML
jgi:hypothetical protein